jgi:uncharacterized membrane protein YcaP (DUF421 family)
METVLRASVLFIVVWAITRGLRRRAIAEMTPFEMILLIVSGDIIQQGVTQEDFSVTGSAVALATFAGWVSLLTWLSYRFGRARRFIEGVPFEIVRDGEPVADVMKIEQMPMADLLEAARQQGIGDLANVRFAVLEPSGRISFIENKPSG